MDVDSGVEVDMRVFFKSEEGPAWDNGFLVLQTRAGR